MTGTKTARRDHWDWGRQADGLRRRRRWKEALACYGKALRLNPLDTVSRDAYVMDLNGKRECLERLGRLAAAARCAKEAGRLRAAWRVKKARAR